MPATVIIDFLSGLPNPQWTIAGDLLVQLKMMLAHLAQFHGAVPEPPGLGYRGLILEFSGEGLEGPLHVYGGFVKGPHAAWIDADRALERWLLEHSIREVPKYADTVRQFLNEVH
jgi:hypothetical protein